MLKLSRLFSAMQPTMFLGSEAIVIGFVVFGSAWPETARRVFGAIQSGIVDYFGWL